jgi:uncharacterized RDD family membrane protein YckC
VSPSESTEREAPQTSSSQKDRSDSDERADNYEPATRLALAGFGARLGAMVIDVLVAFTWARGIGAVYRTIGPDHDLWGPFSSSSVIVLVIWWLYFVLATWGFGRTLGKHALGLRVVTTHLGRPDMGTVLFREVVGRILVAASFGIGYLWAAFDRRRQGWHDKVADTLVVRLVRSFDAADPWSDDGNLPPPG